jgi:DNA adenine methylase
MSYNNLSVKELKQLCKEKNIRGYSTKKKQELIDLLNNNTEVNNNEEVNENAENHISLKPLIKWSGGKADEIDKFKQYIPQYETYIEPFVGGGAVYFHLNPQKAVINDIHPELINFYTAIKNKKSQDIYNFMKDKPNNEETYYDIRNNMEHTDYLDDAKRFYYLRKTCYRGMLRYNSSGKFNIPFGKYKTINYEDLLNKNYEKLLENTQIFNTSFNDIFEQFNDTNNFVFLDPPYDSEFTDYGYCSFGKDEHKQLAECFKNTNNKCLMIIGKTDFIADLYKDYIVDEYQKNYKFRLHSGRITNENIDTKHLIIKNYD